MEFIGKADLRTVGLFQERARSQAPFLNWHYPASSVLRACPSPQTAEPAPHGVPVESHDRSPLGLPVFRSISSSRHADAITPTEPLDAVAVSPSGIGLPPKLRRVGFRHIPFRGRAPPAGWSSVHSRFGLPVRSITQGDLHQSTSTNSLHPSSLWLLPAERPMGRMGFAPTGDRRLSRRTEFPGRSSCAVKRTSS
jgi:hypothetical protein